MRKLKRYTTKTESKMYFPTLTMYAEIIIIIINLVNVEIIAERDLDYFW